MNSEHVWSVEERKINEEAGKIRISELERGFFSNHFSEWLLESGTFLSLDASPREAVFGGNHYFVPTAYNGLSFLIYLDSDSRNGLGPFPISMPQFSKRIRQGRYATI